MRGADRRFDPETLTVTPALTGRLLPSPRRRLAAFAVDYILLFVPTVVAALCFSGLALRLSNPAGYRATLQAVTGVPEAPAAQHALMRDLAPVLVQIDADGLPASVKADVEAGRLDAAADRLANLSLLVALDVGGGTPSSLPPGTVRLAVERLIPPAIRSAAMFLVPALYFAIATSRWRATAGKRLLGLEVVRLDGRPLTMLEGIERFGSYFAIAGTLGLGLFELWTNPNRRLAQDLAVGTVVLRRLKS